jgi:hypothetical protein
VRYIVVPTELETGRTQVGSYPVPVDVSRALVSQVDLRLLPSDPGVAVYENTSWGPGRAVLPSRLDGPIPERLGAGADLSGGTPVLAGSGPLRYRGAIPSEGAVLVAEAPSPRWKLSVGGSNASRQSAYGVANAYRTGGPGRATLRFRTPVLRYGFILLQVLLWMVAIRALIGLRRRAVQIETLDARPGRPARTAEPVAG